MPATPPSSLLGHSRYPPRRTRLPNAVLLPGSSSQEREARSRHPDSSAVNVNADEEVDGEGSEDGENAGNGEEHENDSDGEAEAHGEDGEDGEVGEEDEEDGDGENDADVTHDDMPMEVDSVFDPTGLKEIGNLASWTVSTCKPGCGVEALRDDDTSLFWQSDGPQPHHLNIHFSRMVSILSIRIFLDFEADESYTPTRITLLAGTGYHDLIPFSSLEFTQPKGWIDVPLEGVGGGVDGNTLRAFLVQVKVVENHQNGKDTHVRGLRIYARDEKMGRHLGGLEEWRLQEKTGSPAKPLVDRAGILTEPTWMGEVELR